MIKPPPAIERALADAAALVRVSSPMDWPDGFVVEAERLRGMRGVSVGGGRGLAAAYGRRGGVAMVLIDVWQCFADVATPTGWELARLEALVCHEAAHALLSPDASPDHIEKLLDGAGDAVPAYTPETVARHHGPTWAAALWLLADRGAGFRRRWGHWLRAAAGQHLTRYGFPPDGVARATRGADLATPLRRLLAAGGPAETVLAGQLPDEQTRAAAIVAAGIVREPQPTGVGS